MNYQRLKKRTCYKTKTYNIVKKFVSCLWSIVFTRINFTFGVLFFNIPLLHSCMLLVKSLTVFLLKLHSNFPTKASNLNMKNKELISDILQRVERMDKFLKQICAVLRFLFSVILRIFVICTAQRIFPQFPHFKKRSK